MTNTEEPVGVDDGADATVVGRDRFGPRIDVGTAVERYGISRATITNYRTSGKLQSGRQEESDRGPFKWTFLAKELDEVFASELEEDDPDAAISYEATLDIDSLRTEVEAGFTDLANRNDQHGEKLSEAIAAIRSLGDDQLAEIETRHAEELAQEQARHAEELAQEQAKLDVVLAMLSKRKQRAAQAELFATSQPPDPE